MADLCLTNQDMLDRLLEYMIATDYDAAGTTQKLDAVDLLNDGFRRFLRGGYADELQANSVHRWSFLEPVASLTIWGTMTSTLDGDPGVGSTVTVDDNIFDAAMIGYDLSITTGTGTDVYEIVTVISGTQCTVTPALDNSHLDEDAVSISAEKIYPLPNNFGGLVDEPVYDFSGTTLGPDLQRVSPETIRQMWRNSNTEVQSTCYAVEPKDFDGTTGQQWQLLLAPIPDAIYTISYRYSLIVDALEDDTKFPPGGAMCCDVILQSALAAAERKSGDVAGHHEQLYQMMLREAIARDATTMNEVEVEQLTDADAGM